MGKDDRTAAADDDTDTEVAETDTLLADAAAADDEEVEGRNDCERFTVRELSCCDDESESDFLLRFSSKCDASIECWERRGIILSMKS